MLRAFILLILILGAALLAAPFVISSLYVDQRGITIPGRVYFKRETVSVHYSAWHRSSDVTIEYSAPDQPGVSFFEARLDPEHYDAFHKGATVSLHYLRRSDIPTVPLSRILREMHALPTVRLAGQQAFSGLKMFFTGRTLIICEAVAGVVVLLFLWRIAGLPGFWWGVGICGVLAVTALLVQDFPLPTRRPAVNIRQGSGRVSSVQLIDRLLEGNRQRGFVADEPVDVVGIEFVPEGRTEPVVAVDLIDAASVPGLMENSVVAIEYETGSPRTAYIQTATRDFVSRNLRGIAVQIGLYLLVLIAFFAAAHYIGQAFKRLIQRRP